MSLDNVTSFILSKKSVEEAYLFMRKVGSEGFEAVALLAGIIDGNTALITDTIIPVQTTMRTKSGLLYRVEGKELHAINKYLYKNNLVSIAQIHSHPSEAYHSDMD